MKYIVSANEFKTSAKVIQAFIKHTGLRSEDFEKIIGYIKDERWDKIPAEKGVEYVFTEPSSDFHRKELVEVVFTVDSKRNVEFMELLVPWMERVAPIAMAMWSMLKAFKNVADTMRDDTKALLAKWENEEKAEAAKKASEQEKPAES
jgi:hypothetical protein